MRLLVLGGAVTLVGAALVGLSQGACSSDDNPVTPTPADAGEEAPAPPPIPTEEQFKAVAQRSMKTITVRQLDNLSKATADLLAATPDGPWVENDPKLTTMRDAWKKMHIAWENVEPMLAEQYAAQTFAINARIDTPAPSAGDAGLDGGGATAGAGDVNLFDDTGFTGIHAIERILFPNPDFAAVELAAGYKPAGLPLTAPEATDFKTKLVPKLINDVKALTETYNAAPVVLSYAFGRVAFFMEQLRTILRESVAKKERSRYSKQTILDLRAALDGTQLSYKIFQPWLLQGRVAPQDPTKHGAAHDKPIQAGFGDMIFAFTAPQGDAMPPPPAAFDEAAADKNDAFGKLWLAQAPNNDPGKQFSVVSELKIVAGILGLNQ